MNPTGHFPGLLPWLLSLVATLLWTPPPAHAQALPRGATPRGVIVAFMTETCSAAAEIDRSLFRERLAGELAGVDPGAYRGTVPDGARVRIDSIPDLPTDDGMRRTVAFVTVTARAEVESVSLFMRGDSIWHIDAIRRLVPSNQRAQIRTAAEALDTAIFRLRRNDLEHLLMSDDTLAAMLRRSLPAAEKIVGRLDTVRRWGRFALRDFDVRTIDEYRELDDDVPLADLIFYQLDRGSLERLRQELGIRRIDRDARFPRVIFLQGAAIEQSHYGYLHAPSAESLPPLSEREFILIRPVAPGWWLYKRLADRSVSPP
ncbi:MAG TPA: hypothetical protein VNA88_06615 [Candidatus Kapabacteria bacterium]|nr:hypothetical protein [Candidatus Kapabacteria bacterium]